MQRDERRIVGCLTTTPDRISNLKATILSIANQSIPLDEIYLCVPYIYKKRDMEYLIPDEYSNWCSIVRTSDYGPLTKLLGPLLQESNPETIIITFDDDHIYPTELVAKLITKHRQYPNCVIGSSGIKIGSMPFYISITSNEQHQNRNWYNFDVGNAGEPVDILNNYPGALYLRKFFPSLDTDNPNKAGLGDLLESTTDLRLYSHADIIISGFLNKHDIKRMVFKLPIVSRRKDIVSKKNGFNEITALFRALYISNNNGSWNTRTDYIRTKTMTYKVIVWGLLIIFLLSLLLSGIRKNQIRKNF